MHDLLYETNNYRFKYIESYSQQTKKVHKFLFCASANMWICCKTYPCMPRREKFMKEKDNWCAHCKKRKKEKETEILCNEYICL